MGHTCTSLQISMDSIASKRLDGDGKHELGGFDPVHNDKELESMVGGDGDDTVPALKIESETREGEDDDAVMEASDLDTEPEQRKNKNGEEVCMPKRYDSYDIQLTK